MILLISSRHRDRAGFEAVMRGQIQQGGMETDGITPALQYSTLQIVVEENPGQ